MTGRKATQSEVAVGIGGREIRRLEHENKPSHVFVNIAADGNEAGHVENLRGYRPFVRTVTPEIKTFCRREGEDIVIRIIEVREFDFRSHLNRDRKSTRLNSSH